MRRDGHPRVSVCVPVYNGAAYIGECLESVLRQTFDDFELIVCDNCSTDDTGDIVRRYADPRIRYVRNDRNLGLVGNANRSLELARGELVCIFHHDDVMLPENLARKVALLDRHPRVGFVHSNVARIDRAGAGIASEMWASDSRRDYVETGAAVFRRFVMQMPAWSSIFIGAVLARRSCYDRLGGFTEELPHCNDSEMWMRMLLFSDVACIGEPLVRYRVHPSSTSGAWGDYRSLPYLREHHRAVSLVFERYGSHIPERRRLWRAVSTAFAARAVGFASGDVSGGDMAAGRALLREALRFDPRVVGTVAFWKALASSLAGRDALRMFRKVRDLVRAA